MPKLAAVLFEKGQGVDPLLETVARDLQAVGHGVEGYLQRQAANGPRGRRAGVQLESIANGGRCAIFQPLGNGARGCRLDPQALPGLCSALLERLSEATALLVLNRFGKSEAEGGGFRAAIERAFLCGIPVLTAVRPEYLPQWRGFTGGWHAELAPAADVLGDWAAGVIRRPVRLRRLGSGGGAGAESAAWPQP